MKYIPEVLLYCASQCQRLSSSLPQNGRGRNRLCLQLCLSWAGEVRFSRSGPTIDITYYWACSRWILTGFGLLQQCLSAKSDPHSLAEPLSHCMFHTHAADYRCSRSDAAERLGVRQKTGTRRCGVEAGEKEGRKKNRKGEPTAKPRDTAPRLQSTKSEIRSQKLEVRSHQGAKLKIGGEPPVVRSGQATDSDDDTA